MAQAQCNLIMASYCTVNTWRAVPVFFGRFSAGIFTHLAETIFVFLVERSSEQLLLRFAADLRPFFFSFSSILSLSVSSLLEQL
jgi:hypothetical protein